MTDRSHDWLVDQMYAVLQVDRVSKNGKQVKAGAHFADGLLFIIGHPLCWLPDHIREVAADFANAVRLQAVEYRPRRRGTAYSPVDGLKQAKPPAPIYCAVVRHRREPDTYAWLRVALLEVAVAGLVRATTPEGRHPRSPLKTGDVEVLQSLLYEPLLEPGGDPLYELIQTLGARLAASGEGAAAET